MKDEKAVSPVVGIMLMIAITIVLGVTLIFFATAFEIQEPAPFVAHASGELVRKGGADGHRADQRVYIYHEGGEPIIVSDMEIVVDSTEVCGKRSRIIDLPVQNSLNSSNIKGDTGMLDKGLYGIDGAIEEAEFSAGEKLMFRINNGEDACPLKKGDQITVKIIHKPTNTIVIEETLTAS